MKDTKTLAVQIPTELFDALDEYIARHPEVKSKKDLITSLIVKLLEDEKDAAPAEE
jgi:metal-responsive CopG/Arc/MetJ family transcriptional regulator